MDQDQKQSSRRDFVKQSTILAGGILAVPLMSKANFFSGANDTIKVALVAVEGEQARPFRRFLPSSM
jgi:hypothetical protein